MVEIFSLIASPTPTQLQFSRRLQRTLLHQIVRVFCASMVWPYHPPGDFLQLFLLSCQSENPHQDYYSHETKKRQRPDEKWMKKYILILIIKLLNRITCNELNIIIKAIYIKLLISIFSYQYILNMAYECKMLHVFLCWRHWWLFSLRLNKTEFLM